MPTIRIVEAVLWILRFYDSTSFQEAFRVLKLGGRLAMAELPETAKNNMQLYVSCLFIRCIVNQLD